MKPFELVNASSLSSALAELASGEGHTVAKSGGVDLLDELKEGLTSPRRLVNLRTIAGLDRIARTKDGQLRIGPLVTLARLARASELSGGYRALAQAAGEAATPQIRNLATVGGNLCQRPRCWYFRSAAFHCKKKGGSTCYAQAGDNRFHAIFDNDTCAIVHPSALAVALVALDARLTIASASKRRAAEPSKRRAAEPSKRRAAEPSRRQLAISEFFVEPDDDVSRENVLEPHELIAEVTLPAARAGWRSVYRKIKEKQSFDWPIAEVVVALELDGDRCRQARIALGAASPVPRRAIRAEKLLAGNKVDPTRARAAAKAALAGATPLDDNRYKLQLFAAVIARAIEEAGRG